MKRFRAEGDFLLRALTDLISQCRSQIHQLEHDYEELENPVGERELPRDVRRMVHQMMRRLTYRRSYLTFLFHSELVFGHDLNFWLAFVELDFAGYLQLLTF